MSNNEYEMICLFRSVQCVKCKQRYETDSNDIVIYLTITELWEAAKRIHKSAPICCILPELIVSYDLALISKTMTENKQADFPEIILPR